MSTLLVEELYSELNQDIAFNLDSRCHIGAIIPYIYIHNAPVGTFKLQMMKGSTLVFENIFTCDEIKASLNTSDNYAHVFYPVIPLTPTQIEKGTYTIKLSSTGYTFTSASYLGWCRQYENVQAILDFEPENDGQNPMAMRIKIYKEGIV